jgi:hypothetical protein
LKQLPAVFLPGKTPHEAVTQHKPDISHLRVFGCTAYVYVQKDQRKSLQSHMQKCVFIGYPAGYKGWLFYNPTTKKMIISERAEFDERNFPGLSKSKASVPIDLQPKSSPEQCSVDFSVPHWVQATNSHWKYTGNIVNICRLYLLYFH